MDFYGILTQVIGGVAYLLLSISYFKKEKKQILFLQIFSYLIFSIHYYMLSGITGATCNILGLVALVLIYLFDNFKVKNKKIITLCLIPFVIIIALITYKDIFSIFPIIASVVAIISFISDSKKIIRIIGVISAICWLVYAIVFHSYISIIFEVVTLIFVIVALFKNNILKSKNKTNNN